MKCVTILAAAAILGTCAFGAGSWPRPVDGQIFPPAQRHGHTRGGVRQKDAHHAPTAALSTASISRVRARLDDMELQLATLLAAPAPGAPAVDSHVLNAKVGYRMVIRHLYDLAANANAGEWRAELVLKADTLAAGLPAFDRLVSQAPQWQAIAAGSTTQPGAAEEKLKASMRGALTALQKFQQASQKANDPITNDQSLGHYLTNMLGPLQPLVHVELAGRAVPVVWPVYSTKNRHAADPQEIPTIEQTVRRVQGDNLMPAMRGQLLAILPALQDEMKTSAKHAEATWSYHVILNALTMAEQVSASTVLSLQARTQLDHQLLIGLILFKDSRTRRSAMSRLDGVGNVASILSHLEKAALEPAQKRAVGVAVQAAVMALPSQVTHSAARSTLETLDRFLTVHDQFIKVCDNRPAVGMAEAWTKIKRAGETNIADAIDSLKPAPETANADGKAPGITAAMVRQLTAITGNLNRLAAMPAAVKEAEAYHPHPTGGVERKTVMWARAIAEHPDGSSPAAGDFDELVHALSVLNDIQRDISATALPENIVARLSDNRYGKFQQKFRLTRQKLIDSMADTTTSPAAFLHDLESQYLLLRVTQDMALLESNRHPLTQLNRWAQWEVDADSAALLQKAFEHSIRMEYIHQTGRMRTNNATDRAASVDDLITIPFPAAARAIDHLALLWQQVGPNLTGSQNCWASFYLQTMSPPKGRILLSDLGQRLAMACAAINSAGYNYKNGLIPASITRLQNAANLLGGLPMRH